MNNLEKDTLFVKVSSNIASRQLDDGLIVPDREAISHVGEEIQILTDDYNVVVVYSGAITTGMHVTGTSDKPDKKTNEGIVQLQRLASIGNRVLANYWAEALNTESMGNLLLTRSELSTESSEQQQALGTIVEHFTYGDAVTVNENDAISHEEISFGDNAILTALLAVGSKRSEALNDNVKVVMLGNIDGIEVKKHGQQTIAHTIKGSRCGNEDFCMNVDTGDKSKLGNGGIASYFQAAHILTKEGIDMYVANGRTKNAIQKVLNGEIGTRFVANV